MPATAQTAVAVIGIDIGKNSFHIVGLDSRGAIVLRQKWSRGQVEARLANMSPCLIGMEACVGAHHLSRKLKALGHDARLMPAKYVRPYSKGQKNDFRDAEAIAEVLRQDAGCERLVSVPGIGPFPAPWWPRSATEMRSPKAVTSPPGWVSVPKQISTGDRTILGKISKRGNRYLRVHVRASSMGRAD